MSGLVASAAPTYLEGAGGQVVDIGVSVANVSDVIDAYDLSVYGFDPSWVVADPPSLSLFPGEIGQITLSLSIPADYPAGLRQLSIHVQSRNDPTQFALAALSLQVADRPLVTAQLDPVSITGGSTAQFGLVVANHGNAAVDVVADAVDPEELAEFAFEPPQFHLLPGEQQVVRADVRCKRPWVGAPKVRVINFRALTPAKVEATGSFVQKPRIGRWLLSLLGLMAAAAVFAVVISRTLNSVVNEAKVGDDVVNEALDRTPTAGADLSLHPTTLTGTVVSSLTGDGLPGVQAQLYSADDGTVPLASAATSTDGTFAFGGLSGGDYKLLISGAGFTDLWYPGGRVFSEGDTITIVTGEPLPLPPLKLGGRPGTVSGKVIADDVSGTTASLQQKGLNPEGAPAVAATVDVSADGSFVLTSVPSPADYTLVIERVGSASETREVSLAAGGTVDDLVIYLRPGDGVLKGTVKASGQPLGGATITATDGTNTLSTVSLTQPDADIGAYVLRGLATPAVYTVTVTRDGYSPLTRTINVTGEMPPVDWTMVPATGSIAGTVTDSLGQPVDSVTITLTGGDVTRSTRTVGSAGDVGGPGSYLFDQLPVPGTYTLTYSGDGLANQVRLVELGGASAADAPSLDVVMSSSTAVIRGLVSNVANALVGGAKVELTNGTITRSVQSAHVPLGEYAFTSVPPGTYTLTATLTGAAPVVQLVTVTPGQLLTANLQLGQQASIVGSVVLADSTPVSGVTVKLFLVENYAAGVSVTQINTDSTGHYEFPDVAAPANYIVAVYSGTSVIDTVFVASIPGTEVSALDLVYV